MQNKTTIKIKNTYKYSYMSDIYIYIDSTICGKIYEECMIDTFYHLDYNIPGSYDVSGSYE